MESWAAGNSKSVVEALSGAGVVGSGVSYVGGWGAEGAAGQAGARALGTKEVPLGAEGGAADEADEVQAFGMAGN